MDHRGLKLFNAMRILLFLTVLFCVRSSFGAATPLYSTKTETTNLVKTAQIGSAALTNLSNATVATNVNPAQLYFIGGTLGITNGATSTNGNLYAPVVKEAVGGTAVPFSVQDTNGAIQFQVPTNTHGVARLGTNVNGITTFSNAPGIMTQTTSNSDVSKVVQTVIGVGIGTNAPAQALDVIGNAKISGTLSNSSSATIGGALYAKGSNGVSQFQVGGTLFNSILNYTNLTISSTAITTNLGNYSIPAATLTNSADRIHARWGGLLALGPNTNELILIFGGTIFLDTGLLPVSNGVFIAECDITRTGVSAQHVEGYVDWSGSAGSVWARTNICTEMTIVNGTANVLALQASCRRSYSVTNNSFRVEYYPAP